MKSAHLFILLSLLPLISGFSQRNYPDYELNEATALNLSGLALKCIHNAYPNKPGHVLNAETDVLPPQQYHPAFYGCYDWHSAVHGHWMLVRLLKSFPNLENAAEIRTRLGESFQPDNILKELEYFHSEGRRSFERMYGWAWLLKLSEEVMTWDDPQAREWSAALQPLSDYLVTAYLEFLPKQDYPIRRGVHPNTAFGLAFGWDHAKATHDEALLGMIESRATDYFLNDTDYPAHYELEGDNFFSPPHGGGPDAKGITTGSIFRMARSLSPRSAAR